MSELLFQPVAQRQGPITKGETTFQFLQRGGREEAVAIRQWMEEWFQGFPPGQKNNLKNRLQLKEFEEFMSAYFELQVSAILRRLNCSIEVEPDLLSSNGTVDFCARNGEDRFYVEATVCGVGRGILSSNSNEEDVVRKIRDNLGELHSNLHLSTEGELCRTLPKQRVVKPFQELLQKHTPEQVRCLFSESGLEIARRYLSTEIREGGWVLEGYLAPPTAPDGLGSVWGPAKGGAVDGSGPLAKALAKKAEDWGKKSLKGEIFVVAINVCHSDFSWYENDTIDIREALFVNPGREGQCGDFRGELRHVNGVIVFGNAVLGNEFGARVRLFKNGNTKIPECLHFLLEERKLGYLLGIAS